MTFMPCAKRKTEQSDEDDDGRKWGPTQFGMAISIQATSVGGLFRWESHAL